MSLNERNDLPNSETTERAEVPEGAVEELSDDELDEAAGGDWTPPPPGPGGGG